MLRPTKHSHPDRTVINASLLLLRKLKNRRIVNYEDLKNYLSQTIQGGDFLFLPALSFLFLNGLIEYRSKIDSIEYIQPNETI